MSIHLNRAMLTLALLLSTPVSGVMGQDSVKAQQEAMRKQEKEARDSTKRAAKEAERARKEAEDAPPATIHVTPLPRAQRPTLSVLDFEYQTVVKQGNYNAASLSAIATAIRGGDPNALMHEDNQNIGAGLASLVKAEIFKGESFRILERQRLNAALSEQDLAAGGRADPRAGEVAKIRKVQAAQFILTGAITKFGNDDNTVGGGGLLKGVLGGIGIAKKKTIVEITAQLLDASTSEVILSLTGRGVSRKGGGLVLGAAGGGAGAVGGSANTNVKESAIGEAIQLAAQDLGAKIVNSRDVILEAAAETPSAPPPQVEETPPAASTASSPEERLKKVEELFRKKVITKVEYDKKRAEILKDM